MEGLVKGDVLVLNFPYSDLVNYKRRPVLVVKVPKGEDILVCQMTGSSFEKSVEIPVTDSDFQRGKLKRQGYIRIDKLFSAEKSLINYKIGSLKSEKFNEILNAIINYLKN
jgi:mRNA interferase MazF